MSVGCSTDKKIPARMAMPRKEEARGQPIPKEQERAEGGDERLNVQDQFTTVGFPYFQRKVKKTVPTAEPANPRK